MASKAPAGTKKPASTAKKKKTTKAAASGGKEEKVADRKVVAVHNYGPNTYTGVLESSRLDIPCLDGQATYSWGETKVSYEGLFDKSMLEGPGKLAWPDGSFYVGQFKGGVRHGQGVFTAKDGVTKYAGDWVQGKRHGKGKLLYSTDGEVFYEGEWRDGKKHGKGKQVWAGGHTYEGAWAEGEIAGDGTMTWEETEKTPDEEAMAKEVYVGQWEGSAPSGEGEHVWVAKPHRGWEGKILHHAGQQMQNRYNGHWLGGQRHGDGAFYYANGSSFSGEWRKNQKSEGRIVQEDGSQLSGHFVADQLVGQGGQRLGTGKSVLNIGGEDNPVRKCIDVDDLGLTNNDYALRETFNMLLRYYGELKHVYFRYRTFAVLPGQDPFTLTQLQFWCLCRDMDCLTPRLSLATINGSSAGGVRFLGEQTAHALGCRRVLSALELVGVDEGRLQRQQSQSNPASPKSVASTNSKTALGKSPTKQKTLELKELKKEPATSPAAGSGAAAAKEAARDRSESDARAKASPSPAGDRDKKKSRREAPAPFEKPPVDRTQDPGGYERSGVEIHAPGGVFLFRHFLEALVRLAVARFPEAGPVDQQLDMLIKGSLLPIVEKDKATRGEPSSPAMIDFAGFYLVEEIRLALGQREERLKALYHTLREPASRLGDCVQSRTSTINAKRDDAVRLKDILCWLDSKGLLMDEIWDMDDNRALFEADLGVMDMSAGTLRDHIEGLHADFADLDVRDPREEDPGAMDSLLGGGLSEFQSGFSGGMGGGFAIGGGGSAMDGLSMLSGPSGPSVMSTYGQVGAPTSGTMSVTTAEDGIERLGAEASEVAPQPKPKTRDQLLDNDFRVTKKEALYLLTEVLSPNMRNRLRRVVEPGSGFGNLSILEYLEEEVIFFEFQRLLVRVCEVRTYVEDPESPLARQNATFGAAERVEAFLDLVVLDDQRYAPKEPRKGDASAEEEEVQEEEPVDRPESRADESRAPSETSERAELLEFQEPREIVVTREPKPDWRGFHKTTRPPRRLPS